MSSDAARASGIYCGENPIAGLVASNVKSKNEMRDIQGTFVNRSCDWTKTERELLKSEFHTFQGKQGVSFFHSCVRVAAMLPNKLVSDVAQRVLWLRKNVSRHVTAGYATPNDITSANQLLFELNSTGENAAQVHTNAHLRKLLDANTQLLRLLEGNLAGKIGERQVTLQKVFNNLLAVDGTLQVGPSAFVNMPRIPVRLNTTLARSTIFVQN